VNNLFLSLFFSTVGAAYFMYGKKQSEIWFMLAGGSLVFYPYLVGSAVAMVAIGIVLMAVPFGIRYLSY
jgi:hypothetical protein